MIEMSDIEKHSTAAILDSFINTVRKSLSKWEGSLDVTDSAGTVKQFVATLVNYDQPFADGA